MDVPGYNFSHFCIILDIWFIAQDWRGYAIFWKEITHEYKYTTVDVLQKKYSDVTLDL